MQIDYKFKQIASAGKAPAPAPKKEEKKDEKKKEEPKKEGNLLIIIYFCFNF